MSDKPEPDFTMSEMMEALYPDQPDVYTGPAAFTTYDLMAMDESITRMTAERRADKAVQRGELVEVKVRRQDRMGRWWVRRAWVLKRIFDNWGQGDDKDG